MVSLGKIREKQGERVFISRPKWKKGKTDVLQIILNDRNVVCSLWRNFVFQHIVIFTSDCKAAFMTEIFHFLQKYLCSQDYSELVGQCWLQSARVARKAGHHQTAYNALLNAGESTLSELYIERAKWLWSKVKKIKIELTFLHARK